MKLRIRVMRNKISGSIPTHHGSGLQPSYRHGPACPGSLATHVPLQVAGTNEAMTRKCWAAPFRTTSLAATLGAIALFVSLAGFPSAAHADYVSNAREALKKGDVKSAQIELRNAVRSDPQNAEAHFLLARVSIELGDPVAAEREARAARERGFDPHQSVPLLTQALLGQGKYQRLLDDLKPDGKDPTLDADILVARGYALIGLKKPDDAQKSFADAQQAAPNSVEPLLADARLSVSRADLNGAQAKIDQAIAAQPKSVPAL